MSHDVVLTSKMTGIFLCVIFRCGKVYFPLFWWWVLSKMRLRKINHVCQLRGASLYILYMTVSICILRGVDVYQLVLQNWTPAIATHSSISSSWNCVHPNSKVRGLWCADVQECDPWHTCLQLQHDMAQATWANSKCLDVLVLSD